MYDAAAIEDSTATSAASQLEGERAESPGRISKSIRRFGLARRCAISRREIYRLIRAPELSASGTRDRGKGRRTRRDRRRFDALIRREYTLRRVISIQVRNVLPRKMNGR